MCVCPHALMPFLSSHQRELSFLTIASFHSQPIYVVFPAFLIFYKTTTNIVIITQWVYNGY